MPPDKSDAEFALDNSSSSLLELSAPPRKKFEACNEIVKYTIPMF